MIIYGVFETYFDCDYHEELIKTFKDKKQDQEYQEQEQAKLEDYEDIKYIIKEIEVI